MVCKSSRPGSGWSPISGAARLCYLAFAMVALVATPGRSEETWVGKRVIQKDPEFRLQIGAKVIERHGVIDIYRVEQENGPWLWVKSERTRCRSLTSRLDRGEGEPSHDGDQPSTPHQASAGQRHPDPLPSASTGISNGSAQSVLGPGRAVRTASRFVRRDGTHAQAALSL